MKFFIFSLLSCSNTDHKDRLNTSLNSNNGPSVDSSFLEESRSLSKIDTVSFSSFEYLVKNEEEISHAMRALYLPNIDTFIHSSSINAVGKGISYRRKYKRFNLIYGNKDKAYNLILTYSLKNKLIDYKEFMYSCFSSGSKELWADVQELDDEKTIIVRYFDPILDRSMPSEKTQIVRRINTWAISSKGEIKFVK